MLKVPHPNLSNFFLVIEENKYEELM